MQLLEGKRKESWVQWSSLMSLMHNLWSTKARAPEDFNPTRIKVPGISGDKIASMAKSWISTGD